MTVLRTDIQALRGWAVLVVVLYHVQIGPFDAGFLGVDIFFVISGYLITTLIAQGIAQGRFSLREFYVRRAKRLLPAAYVVILVTALAAPWFLNQQEMDDLVWQVVGAVTFTANLVFWQQTDYFGGQSDLKPLLHTWSLSVEEQYYMLLPALLLLLGRQRWMRAIVLVLLASLALCLVGAYYKPVITFYLLPTRAWELLMGSVGALWVLRQNLDRPVSQARLVRALYVPALLLLLVVPAVRVPGTHPGAQAILVCTATLLTILRNHQTVSAARPTRWLGGIGDLSYSLYLVHWPIVALLRNAWAGAGPDPTLPMRIGALGASLGLAYLLYRYVENPLRRSGLRFSWPVLARVGLASVLLMAVTPLTIELTRTDVDYRHLRRVNFGFGPECEFKADFVAKAECRNSDTPTVMVWGDSFAMHLVPGLRAVAQPGEGLIQATMSGCGPFIGLAPRRLIHPGTGSVYDRHWATACLSFNQSVLDYLRRTDSIRTVVMSSIFSAYVAVPGWNHILATAGGLVEMPSSHVESLKALVATVKQLQSVGKKVVLVAPPPVAAFNIGGCLEREATGRVILGAAPGCEIPRGDYLLRRRDVIALLREAENQGVPVIWFDGQLCGARVCKTMIDNIMVYKDTGHFSHEGAVAVARRVNLGESVRAIAR